MNGNGDRSLAALAQLTLNRHRDQLDNLLEEEGEGRDDLEVHTFFCARDRSQGPAPCRTHFPCLCDLSGFDFTVQPSRTHARCAIATMP
jgi:hypothetical protein